MPVHVPEPSPWVDPVILSWVRDTLNDLVPEWLPQDFPDTYSPHCREPLALWLDGHELRQTCLLDPGHRGKCSPEPATLRMVVAA